MSNPYYQDDPALNLPTGLPGYSQQRRTSYASMAANPGGFGRSGATFQHLLNANNGDGSDSNSLHNGLDSSSSRILRPSFGSLNSGSNAVNNGSNPSADANSLWIGGDITSDSSLLRLVSPRNAQLPSFSRAFEPFLRGPPYANAGPAGPAGPASNTAFFTPSYLRDSVYVQRLEAQYQAKIQAAHETQQQEELRARQAPAYSQATALLAAHDAATAALPRIGTRGLLLDRPYGGLDDYASLTNISITNAPTVPNSSKLPTMKRDLAFELDDRTSGRSSAAGGRGAGASGTGVAASLLGAGEAMAPLPSRWDKDAKAPSLDVLSDGLDVKFSAARTTGEHGQQSNNQEAGSVRADHYMPPECGIYYFEATVLSKKREESTIGIGFCEEQAKLSRPPGWEAGSWAYHSDDGNVFTDNSGTGKHYGPAFGPGDVVGCGVNFRTGTAFFTKNGEDLGIAFRDIKGPGLKLFPVVGMKKIGEQVRVNFGQLPFTFDIDGLMKREKQAIRQQISEAETQTLGPAVSETDLVQQLVLQFLQNDGYVDTARAFAKEVQAEKTALNIDPDRPMRAYNVADDEDAHKRQRIRRAILEGDIDRAIELTREDYPGFLERNELVQFRLKCRKFIEMIRKEAELNLVNGNGSNGSNGSTANTDGSADGATRANGHGHQGMDVDDMLMEDGSEGQAPGPSQSRPEGRTIVNEALEYGQQLQAEFVSELRPPIQKTLNEIFSLLAYANPLKQPEVAHLLDQRGRAAVAEDANAAILEFLGKSSRSALETLYSQTNVLLEELRQEGGPGSFVTIQGVLDEIPQSYSP